MAADEPRRSGRATKGQHKNIEAEPAPKTKKAGKAKGAKKASEPEEEEEDDDESQDEIRCVCGDNEDTTVGRVFVSCDSCEVWQHNACMGVPLEESEVPEHYFCEQCRPEEHKELLDAMARGEPIWLERQKAAKSKRKPAKQGKKGGRQSRVSDIKPDGAKTSSSPAPTQSQESGTKRKFEEESPAAPPAVAEQTSPRESRQASDAPRVDKRRKSSVKGGAAPDAQTALVDIEQLPDERRNAASALHKQVLQGVRSSSKAGRFRIPDGETADSIGKRLASRIEYELFMNHVGTGQKPTAVYINQFRQILANIKKNDALLDRLLKGSLSPAEVSTMSSQDMASEELQKQRAQLKEEADKQAVMIREDDAPRVRRTHKGEEYVDDGAQHDAAGSVFASQPVRHRESVAENEIGEAISPPAPSASTPDRRTGDGPLPIDTSQPAAGLDRRTSSQQFDINNVWAKTQQSPDTEQASARASQAPRRQSSAPKPDRQPRTEDADVDRLLADDNDDSYSPNDLQTSDSSIIWRGKLVQPGVAETNVSGRFIAGNDFGRFVPWQQFLPSLLEIEGRLERGRADEYLCGLQWSKKSDVSVIALTPYDNRDSFDAIFDYFATRGRYAVGKKAHGISDLVKDLYISPVGPGSAAPPHVDLLDYVGITLPLTERMLFATYVVNKPVSWDSAPALQDPPPHSADSIPPHVRHSMSGPAGSPIASQAPPMGAYPPPGGYTPDAGNGAYVGGGQTFGSAGLPPNPYSAQQQQGGFVPSARVQAALGPYANGPVVAQVVNAAGNNLDETILQNMRVILEKEPRAREDMNVFAALLHGQPT